MEFELAQLGRKFECKKSKSVTLTEIPDTENSFFFVM